MMLCWAALMYPVVTTGQCLSPELALINSCIDHPNPNGSGTTVESELLVLSSGLAPLPVTDIGFDLPNNSFGAANADVGVSVTGTPLGCTFKEPTITALPGCANVVPLGPNDTIPANARIVFFTTGTTQSADLSEVDFSNICPAGEPVYVLQNQCERTSGAFANGPGSGDPLRTITVISDCGLRGFTYNTQQLTPAEGTYYLVGSNEVGNLNCDLPVIPETCPGIDTTFYICDPAGDLAAVMTDDLASIYPSSVLDVSFHPTPLEAEANENEITTYTPTGAPLDTLYARIINSVNFCISVNQLVIQYQGVGAMTTAPMEPIRGCDPAMTGTGVFNLLAAAPEIGGGQPVTFFTDAAATQVINTPEAYSSATATIFARAGILNCQAGIVPVELRLEEAPAVSPMVQETSCPNSGDGRLSLDVTGNGPFSYAWGVDTLPDQPLQLNLTAGDYAWSVTDGNGCVVAGTTAVLPGEPTLLGCQVNSSGGVNVTLAEGSPPYQVSYTGAAAGAVEVTGAMGELTGLAAGDYAILATDAAGCISDTCFAAVGQAMPIVLQCAVRNNSDGAGVDGSILVDLDGGTPPFTVQIAGGPGSTTLTNQSRGEIVFSGLGVATYTITVTDAAGLVATCTQEVMQDNCPLTIVDVQLLVSDCSGADNTIIRLTLAGNDGMINTTWSGGNNIEIFNGLQEAGPLPPGDYFVAVSDQSGCPPVMAGPIPVVNAGPIQSAIDGTFVSNACTDEGELNVTVLSGGTSPFLIQLEDVNGTPIAAQEGTMGSFSNLAGGDGSPNYRVYVTDALGCSSDTSLVTISTLPEPTILLEPANQGIISPTCLAGTDGALSLMATGGTAPYTYTWLDYPERSEGSVYSRPRLTKRTCLRDSTLLKSWNSRAVRTPSR